MVNPFSHVVLDFQLGGEGVFHYMGYIRMCGTKGCGSSAILVINRVRFCTLALRWVCFYKRSDFFHYNGKENHQKVPSVLFKMAVEKEGAHEKAKF